MKIFQTKASGALLILICLCFSTQAFCQERGKALFNLCISCHGPDGHGNEQIGAPAIAGLPDWYIEAQLEKFASGARGQDPSDDNGNRMRPMARTMTPDDFKMVAAYVSSLHPLTPIATVGGDADKGKLYFNTCIACHGPHGDGNPAVHAPPLRFSNDWYLVHQLMNFKTKVRASNPAKDPVGAAMSPMAGTLPNEQAMKDVVTYAQSIK